MDEQDNVTPFRVVSKDEPENNIPQNDYVITDIEGEQLYASGFLIFTPHHVVIMRDDGKGAIPSLVVPLFRVSYAGLVDDEEELPF